MTGLSGLIHKSSVGQTPRRLVWSQNKAKLYFYESAGPERRHSIPLLVIYAPIGRPCILDLYPGHSFVDWMRRRGLDVFLLDWGRPGPEDRTLGLSGYVRDYLPAAVETVREITGAREYSMLGWSTGGLFAAIHAALSPEGLRNLVLVTAPIDFARRDEIPLARMVDERWFALDRVLAGNVPGEWIACGAILCDPMNGMVRPYRELWKHYADPEFRQHWHAMSRWASDLVPMTGALFRDLVELYRSNRLMRGELTIGDQCVDLGKVRARLLNIVANDDRVTPPCQSERLLDIVRSREKQTLRLRGTHIESMAGMRAPQESWPAIHEWLAKGSQ